MKPCKRIEIVIEQSLERRLAAQLEALGAPGYTLISQASGLGNRGPRRGDEPTGTASNCVFIIACDDEASAQHIVDGIRPLLTRSGGICLVSDAMWLLH